MKTEFEFAGFAWPRHVVELPKTRIAARLAAFKKGECPAVSPYYHAPKPLSGMHPGRGFYLDDAGMPGLRWTYAHDVDGARIEHTGWYADDDGTGDTIKGVIFRLPHDRGFLIGWTYGEGMSATLTGDIVADETEAAYAADRVAELAAEKERDYNARWRAATNLDDDISDKCKELRAIREDWSGLLAAWIDARTKSAEKAAANVRESMVDVRARFERAAEALRDFRAQLPEFADVER